MKCSPPTYFDIKYVPTWWTREKTQGYFKASVTGMRARDLPDTAAYKQARTKYTDWYVVEVEGGFAYYLMSRAHLQLLLKKSAMKAPADKIMRIVTDPKGVDRPVYLGDSRPPY